MDSPHVALLLGLFETGRVVASMPGYAGLRYTGGSHPVRTLNFTYLYVPRIEPVPSAKTLGKTSTKRLFTEGRAVTGCKLSAAAGWRLARDA
ncbi:hypothetical protein DN523_13070 [Burkholderia multivorans]|nr:hypothetical protein DN470_26530 [Burkholderia multivorans]RAA29996.1 hypothetical protein DN471_07730 [Burkholderia multivorans]RAA39134.1 hypothetical protein DN465_01695 [Burkholderia multivorans]RAA39323.1 hypothetical protein DN500_24215 [Burkholderia multivorans]RAA43373.1 hypothetical protein DN472_16345 [Burkholderia multivorans]